eukprot:jgi/Galph1/3300/GphlegSOOS_G2002.1
MATHPQQNLYSQLEHLQAKYVGTGHPDISRHEWATNMARDSIATYMGHRSMLLLFATAEGESIGRVRYNLLEKLHSPYGEVKERVLSKKERLQQI